MKKFLIPVFTFLLLFLWVGEGAAFPNDHSSEMAITDPKEVIARYIEAVGGKENVAKIKNSVMTMEAEMQGMTIQIFGISDQVNGRFLQVTTLMGNEASRTVLANGKGKITAMGQENDVPEEMLPLMKVQTYVFPEEHYEEMGYTLELQGTEDINGEETYRLLITAPNDLKTVEYFAVGSGLKLRTSSDATGDISYSDYREVDGVKFPMRMSISNAMMPMALETKVVSIAFNQELSDEDFK
jgi:hypothetical protein